MLQGLWCLKHPQVQKHPCTHGVVMGGEVEGVLVCQQLVVGVVLVALLAIGTVIVVIQDLGEKQEDRGQWEDPSKLRAAPPVLGEIHPLSGQYASGTALTGAAPLGLNQPGRSQPCLSWKTQPCRSSSYLRQREMGRKG